MPKLKPLKPCPFCGGKARLVTLEDKTLPFSKKYVVCNNCLAQTFEYYSVEELAVKAWNRRDWKGENNEQMAKSTGSI